MSLAPASTSNARNYSKRNKARLLVRPHVLLNGMPVTLSVLKEPSLLIRAADIDGISSTREITDFRTE